MYAIFDHSLTKIDYYAQFKTGESKVGECLRLKYGVIVQRCFTFDNDFTIDQQVYKQWCRQDVGFIGDWDFYLSSYMQAYIG